MVGKTIHNCSQCEYKTTRRWDRDRHFQKIHAKGIIYPQQPEIRTPTKISNDPTQAPTSIQLHHQVQDQQQQDNVYMGTKGVQPQTSNLELVPEIRTPTNIQVHHHAQDRQQQNNERSLISSKRVTDKFDRLYQAVHGKTTNVNQSQEGSCNNPMCTIELCDDIGKVRKEFNKIGVECFTKCSDKEVKSVCFIANTMMMSSPVQCLKDYRSHLYEGACRLLKPSEQLVEQLACPRTSVQEKRKILQQTNLGAMLLLIAVNLVIPTLSSRGIEQDILNRFFR